MIIQKLPLSDAAIIDAEPFEDNRGLFARYFCSRELEHIMKGRTVVNVNFSCTSKPGTIRGMHFQLPPHQEMKLVRCIQGAVYDVIVDIRKSSPTYLQWHGETLSAENMKMLCVPEGFAHGFQALDSNAEVLYLTTAFYNPKAEAGIRYDDPLLNIKWPIAVTEISTKDLSYQPMDGRDLLVKP